jgi:hypothetical protein
MGLSRGKVPFFFFLLFMSFISIIERENNRKREGESRGETYYIY